MTGQEARDDEREALYVPTMEEVRGIYAVYGFRGNRPHEGQHQSLADWRAEFDRWLAAHDADLLARKHPEPETTDAEVARLQGIIAEVRKAWWTATEYNDAGNVIYTDDIEAAMDSIWAATAEETLGVPVGEGEQQ